MWNRRDFLKATALASVTAVGALPSSRLRAATMGENNAGWPPFGNVLAIDGAGGSGLYWIDDDTPDVSAELAHLRASGLSGMVVTVAPQGRFWLDDAAFHRAQDVIATWKRKIALHPDALILVERFADLAKAKEERRVGVIFTFQGTESLGEDPDRIALFHRQGLRVVQLTHNRRNLVGDGCMEPGNAGLSNYGREIVERLNAQRMIVDLAHGSRRTIAEAILASKAPVLISHTGCRALADLPRNTGDDELRAMAERGGVAGIIFWPYLRTDTQPMETDVIRHIEHAIDVCGEDHVGIGTDGPVAPIDRASRFERDNRAMIANMKEDGVFEKDRPADLYTFIPDLNMANRFEVLANLLSVRGHSDTRITKVLGGNFARVMREVWA